MPAMMPSPFATIPASNRALTAMRTAYPGLKERNCVQREPQRTGSRSRP
jgi:hypothetical protein